MLRLIGKPGRESAHAYVAGRLRRTARFLAFEANADASGGGAGGAGDAEAKEVAERLAKVEKELAEARDQAAKSRIRTREAETAVKERDARLAKVQEKLGVDSIDSYLNDEHKPPAATTAPLPPEFQAHIAAVEQKMQKRIDAESAARKAAEEKFERERNARETESRRGQITNWMLEAGVPRERLSKLMLIQEGMFVRNDETNQFERDEESGRVLQWYDDPKTNERTKAPLSEATVQFNIPPEFLPAKTGPGSGGGPPNALGGPKGKGDETIAKGMESQSYFEEHQKEINAKLRGSQLKR